MGEFRMPSLGADMEAGTLVEWLVKPGTMIRRGDVIATVETQKGLFEVEAFEDGTLGPPLVRPGERVPVGAILAMINDEQRAAPPPSPPPRAGERIAASPSARKLAAELGVDLAVISGSGPHGAIQRSDVEQAAELSRQERQAEPPPATQTTLREGMRQAIAAAMSRSNREIPHYYLGMEIDLSRPLGWLEDSNRQRPIRERILPAALLLKGVARALVTVPELNGYWQDNRLQLCADINIGFAIALRGGGLITPAIHHVDRLTLQELMAAMGELIERTRAGRLRSSEMADATITVTNLGDLGVETVYGVIYPPQVALVAFGRIMERPWAESGMLGVRRTVTATLAADHRATDGHRGSQFLEALSRALQEPEKL